MVQGKSSSANNVCTGQIAVAAFYEFVNIENPEHLWQRMMLECRKKSVLGTIIIAPEGFNGSISGAKENVQAAIDRLIFLSNSKDIFLKWNYCDFTPFSRLKVKIKPEIIAMKIDNPLDVENLRGRYVESKDWDDFIASSNVVTIDTRNDYEIEHGSFKGAINPHTKTFREFPKWAYENRSKLEGKKVAMCCTGGVRCEKSTAYLASIGIKDVYHLRGGILQYLEDTGNQSGKWEGECFVFDDRTAVDDDLAPAS